MSRLARRKDANQGEIEEALTTAGYHFVDTSRLGFGFPDLIVASKAGQNVFVEVKMPGAKLTPDELKFHSRWPNRIEIAYSAEQILRALEMYDVLPARHACNCQLINIKKGD